jgi:ubiquinone biosynthesis protein COQ4
MSHPIHAVKSIVSLLRIIKDPTRLSEVFELADSLLEGAPESRKREIIDALKREPSATNAFAEKVRLPPIDLDALIALAEGSLGHVFAKHMRDNHLDPSALPSIESHTDLQFLRAHLYETHDIWHSVTGFSTDVAGELGLQAFYLAQMPSGLPPALLGGSFFNTLLFAMHERDARMRAIVRGWLLGKRAKPFFGIRWHELWSTPIADVRRMLKVEIDAVDALLPDLHTGLTLAEAA